MSDKETAPWTREAVTELGEIFRASRCQEEKAAQIIAIAANIGW